MKGRIPMLWLSVLTVYMAYVTTDARSALKSVEANQEYTLQYMQKSASILKRFKKVRVPAEVVPITATASSASSSAVPQ